MHMTVGLIATFMTVLCIIAADTGAYFFGKSMVSGCRLKVV